MMQIGYCCLSIVVNNRLTILFRLGRKPLASTQSICISGLGSEAFNPFCAGLNAVYGIFKERLAGATLVPLTTREERDFITLFFSNRYFTHAQNVKKHEVVPISKDVDPLGILAGIKGGIYTSDNDVRYYERTLKDGKT